MILINRCLSYIGVLLLIFAVGTSAVLFSDETKNKQGQKRQRAEADQREEENPSNLKKSDMKADSDMEDFLGLAPVDTTEKASSAGTGDDVLYHSDRLWEAVAYEYWVQISKSMAVIVLDKKELDEASRNPQKYNCMLRFGRITDHKDFALTKPRNGKGQGN